MCFNDTATTEIYTNRHTLSLHDALPSAVGPTRSSGSPRRPSGMRCSMYVRFSVSARSSLLMSVRIVPGSSELQRMPCLRSEEHTSELRSLMRISYAVFCLKKQHLHNYIILFDSIHNILLLYLLPT